MSIRFWVLRQRNHSMRILTAFLLTLYSYSTAATVMGDLAAQMQPGTWAELTTTNSELLNATDFIFEFSDEMVWDSIGRKSYFLGASDPNDKVGNMKLLSYDDATNSWVKQPDPFFAPGAGQGNMHGYKHHAIDVQNRRLYYKPFGANPIAYVMNLDSGVWTRIADIVGGSQWITNAASLTYFPERDKLYFHNSETDGRVRQLHEYTYGAGNLGGSWKFLGAGLNPSSEDHAVMIHNPVHGVIWFGGGDGTTQMWKLDAAGNITKLAATPAGVAALRTGGASNSAGSVITVDPASGDFLVLAGTGGGGGGSDSFWKYNITTDTWTQMSGNIPPFASYPSSAPIDMSFFTAAVPIDTYGVVMVIQYDDSKTANNVWLYKHAQSDTTIPSPATQLNAQ